jgi:phage tail sheath protein FI
MALPTSPSVVVRETDASIYTPNVESSVVAIVGFADKGPIDTPTLVTSQNDLINKFGKPNSNIPGQGLEGALEILETTNQLYFTRAASDSGPASSQLTLGFCPAIFVSSLSVTTAATSILYSVVDNAGTVQTNAQVVSLASSTGVTTSAQILNAFFDPSVLGDQDVFAQFDASGNGYLVGRYAGSSTRLSVSSSDTSVKFYTLDADGWHTSGAGGSSVTASGGTAVLTGSTGFHVRAYSNYHGTGYNLSSNRDGSINGLSVEVENLSIRDSLVVNSEGTARESFQVVLSPSSPASIEYLLVDDDTNNQSNYIFAQMESNGTQVAIVPDEFSHKITSAKSFAWSATTGSFTPKFVKLIEGTYSLSGGRSGYSTTEVGSAGDIAALIGTAADKTGIYSLDDDSLGISLALVPGITHQQVQNALISLAESSQNFVALVSPPYGLDTVQDAVQWMNGKETRTAAINNSYAAVYWPWVQVFNFYAAADEWYDPAIFAARQCVFTDNVSEPWFAPAGYRRGRLSKPSDVEVVLNQGDKDALYSNNINPITKEPQGGIVIFGQKTGQRLPTALDRINVRRLMIFIRKTLLQLGKPFQFEPNDQFTWELVEDAVRPFLDDLLARRAIVEGDVICNSTTNTPLRVDRNELWCSVVIKPTKSAETIVFDVNLTNQSATING